MSDDINAGGETPQLRLDEDGLPILQEAVDGQAPADGDPDTKALDALQAQLSATLAQAVDDAVSKALANAEGELKRQVKDQLEAQLPKLLAAVMNRRDEP